MQVRKFLPYILVAVISLGVALTTSAVAGDPDDPNFMGPRAPTTQSTLEIPYTPLVKLPIGGGGSLPDTWTISTYLAGMYRLIIALGAAVAVLMGIVGGMQYIASGITPGKKNEAKDRISNAVIGLVIVLTSYLILNTIDPKLVKFEWKLPPISGTHAPTTTVAATDSVVAMIIRRNCDSFPDVSASDWEALSMERGESVVWTSSNENVQRNLDKLRIEVAKFETLVSSFPGASVTINSAYRPLAYQEHLYELGRIAGALNSSQSLVQACPGLKQRVDADVARHGINGAGVVALPNGCAPHVRGIGVDLKINGTVPFSESEGGVNGILMNRSIDLRWSAIGGDPFHYELRNPPFSGCAN